MAKPDPEEVSATHLRVDLHSHSSVSDGLDSPRELVARMSDAGVGAFALTDHDTLQGLPDAREEARQLGIELIPGAEISANSAGQDDVHILALFVDETNVEFNAHLTERQEGRRRRGERIAQKLVEAGFAIDLDAIRADVGDGVWGRPHIARALIRAGYAASNDEAFDRFLGTDHPWYVPHDKWAAADVLDAVHRAGGVCSLAHAVWYPDAETVIAGLAAHGLDALEVFHPDHGIAEVERFGRLARELGLVATAGSDFHGSIEGRKSPGGVSGDREMLEAIRARARPR
ncbi:MAG TPA: PHP domain-containing protein [Thermoanaerobaculia bacterium]|nr:PHP domain-containing protein [Thermoanaerobaculia bacterium]